MKWLLIPVFLLGLFPAVASAQTACRFVLGFQTMSTLVDVGPCLDNQAPQPNGDAIQHTTRGLLVWRKADNWTAFTDGSYTWINGPFGLAQRLNGSRFPWESQTADSPTAAPEAPGTAFCEPWGCYYGDASLKPFLEDALRTPSAQMLKFGGVTLRIVNDLPPGAWSGYAWATDTVGILPGLPQLGEYETAAALAHELTHALQFRNGLAYRGLACYQAEAQAFAVQGRVWSELWGGKLPPSDTPLRADANTFARHTLTVSDLLGPYSQVCGPPV